ncbi:MAG TPA: hypothetical protein VGO47_04965, partial [Chlamydiales bacterium]|nr:hypothetical protein [Chlamydiales bacterium]
MTSFSKLYIRNILKNDPDFTLELQPGALVPSRRYDDSKLKSEGPSESSLSSHRDAHLHLSLGPKIGCGRIGTVHDVIPLDKSGSPVEWSSLVLPPLVVKIASVNRNVELSKEAWFYEQLKDLQNVAIARCYGFFQTALRPEHVKHIAQWKDGHGITPSPSPQRFHTGASA